MLASLIGLLGDFDLAEEAAQEAFAIAAERWPRDGVPLNPAAWLIATGRNRAIDRIRRERTGSAKAKLLEPPQVADQEMDKTAFPDERLELVFTCCHSALGLDAQVALTLRTLGGLGTDEVARAFVVSKDTMAKRIVRAKKKMAETEGPEAGLKAIEGLDELDSYPYLHATRADFLRRLERTEEARVAYERALELTRSEPDRRFLARRLAETDPADR